MARNRHRTAGPINRTLVAPRESTFYTGPLTPSQPRANVGRRGRRPSTDKGQDLWRTTSAYYHNAVTIDSRWSQTVSD